MRNTNNRPWLVVLGAILIQICIGSVYSWSLFNNPLSEKFGWDKNSIVFTFSMIVFVFALTTIYSGKLQDKIGPKKVSLMGGIIYGIGLFLTSTATTILELYIYYGVIAGIGIGFCYVCPLSTCVKWFPHKKGLITGITVGAFGLGSMIFESVIETLILNKGVSETFLYLGVIYTSLIVIGSLLLSLPSQDYLKYKSIDSFSNNLKSNKINLEKNYTLKEMIKTDTFPWVWILYLLGTITGLLIIGLAKDIGVQLVGLDEHTASMIVAVIAIFNASGRLILGSLSDKLGCIRVILILFIATALAMFYMSFINLTLVTFFITVSIVTFCFGGYLAIFPVLTGNLYGTKNLGANYGLVYQAYGISALVGPIISANADSLINTFLISGIIALVGILLTFKVKSLTKAHNITI